MTCVTGARIEGETSPRMAGAYTGRAAAACVTGVFTEKAAMTCVTGAYTERLPR